MEFLYRKYTLESGEIVYRPEVSVLVEADKTRQTVGPCLLDTGSDKCIFSLEFAEIFNHKIDLKSKMKTSAAGGDTFYIYPSPKPVQITISQDGFRAKSWKTHIFYAEKQEPVILGFFGFINQFDKIVFKPKEKKFTLN
ncbi:MAG: hypothetical protein AB7J40_02075 [Candidatus Altimarinota bacterium]